MAKVNYSEVADDILGAVGGAGNVREVTHCATRLRFVLNDSSKAARPVVQSLPGVITVVENSGQFQVVIGNNVGQVYNALPSTLTSEERTGTAGAGAAHQNPVSRVIDVMSGIFGPLLGVMAAVAMLKGLLMILSTTGILATTSTTYNVLYAAADAFFAFLPIMIAATSARQFGSNMYTAMALAGALLYTQLIAVSVLVDGKATKQTLQAFLTAGNPVEFLGIPMQLPGYSGTVIPIILAVWAMSYLEKGLNEVVHEAVRNFVTPLIALVVMVPLSLLTIGPAATWLAKSIAGALMFVYGLSPLLTGALIAALWQVLVIFGVHWGLVPIFLNNISVKATTPSSRRSGRRSFARPARRWACSCGSARPRPRAWPAPRRCRRSSGSPSRPSTVSTCPASGRSSSASPPPRSAGPSPESSGSASTGMPCPACSPSRSASATRSAWATPSFRSCSAPSPPWRSVRSAPTCSGSPRPTWPRTGKRPSAPIAPRSCTTRRTMACRLPHRCCRRRSAR
jgi:glucose-like phosphotransferase system IIB component